MAWVRGVVLEKRKEPVSVRIAVYAPRATGAGHGRSTSAAHRFSANVEVIEPMGAEAFLYLNTGSNAFIARVEDHAHARAGAPLELSVDMEKAHFFRPTENGDGEVVS